MTAARLTADDWLAAARSALREDGHAALTAEGMARRLGTTKGSFYWHFKDLDDFHGRISALWLDQAQVALEAWAGLDTPVAALRDAARILGCPETDPEVCLRLEANIRAWAGQNHTVANVVQRIDLDRLQAIGAAMGRLGIRNPDLVLAFHMALTGLVQPWGPPAAERRAAVATLADLILAMR